jgi:hypothetical protein
MSHSLAFDIIPADTDSKSQQIKFKRNAMPGKQISLNITDKTVI